MKMNFKTNGSGARNIIKNIKNCCENTKVPDKIELKKGLMKKGFKVDTDGLDFKESMKEFDEGKDVNTFLKKSTATTEKASAKIVRKIGKVK
jgi:hypothetical protein